jgi:hypothetical protein
MCCMCVYECAAKKFMNARLDLRNSRLRDLTNSSTGFLWVPSSGEYK